MSTRCAQSNSIDSGIRSRLFLLLLMAAAVFALSAALPSKWDGAPPVFAQDELPGQDPPAAQETPAPQETPATPDGAAVADNAADAATADQEAPTEDTALASAADSAPAASANAGPVRLARFSLVEGSVTWRSDADTDWADAVVNLPLREGAQVWTADSSRSEVQFDDGSRLRLDSNTLVTIQTLYSDSQGEFTEITLNNGRVFLRLSNEYSVYQVNTPIASVKATGPARLGVSTGSGLQVSVRQGAASVQSAGDNTTLHEGDYLDALDANATFTVGDLPTSSAWDRWNDACDRESDGLPLQPSYRYLPANIAICADNLDSYGTWSYDPSYSWVWVPRVRTAHWRPYSDGRWTWVEPFGWTWVSNEPWGWAPYHYGTWVTTHHGWAWVPGPVAQYWCPGVVSFYQCGDSIAWCPLGPHEVVYPARLALGFGGGNWSRFFSIGRAGVYYPTHGGVCAARPWGNGDVNRGSYRNADFHDRTINRNTFLTGSHILPANARMDGASYASLTQFGGRTGGYHPIAGSETSKFFQGGRVVGAPDHGRPVAGPQSVRPAHVGSTSTGFSRPAPAQFQEILSRPIYRAPLPARVQSGPGHSNAPGLSAQGHGLAGGPGTSVHGNYNPSTPVVANQGRENRPTMNSPMRSNAPVGASSQHSNGLDEYLRERSHGDSGVTPGGAIHSQASQTHTWGGESGSNAPSSGSAHQESGSDQYLRGRSNNPGFSQSGSGSSNSGSRGWQFGGSTSGSGASAPAPRSDSGGGWLHSRGDSAAQSYSGSRSGSGSRGGSGYSGSSSSHTDSGSHGDSSQHSRGGFLGH